MRRTIPLTVIAIIIFSCISQYTAAQYTVLYNFNSYYGQQPYGCSLILWNNVLYGMTTGAFNPGQAGNIFSINPDGTGYRDLYDFTDSAGGSTPWGSLVISNGIMYGMTEDGGIYAAGNVFSIDTGGRHYKDLHDFSYGPGYPAGSLILLDSVLYGMTATGDSNNLGGNVFSIDTIGNNYTDLHDFPAYTGSYGSLLLLGNTFYGMVSGDSSFIFSINTDGSNYRLLYVLSEESHNGSLTFAGNRLYGMLVNGGAAGLGSIFSIDTDGSNYVDMHDFDGYSGGSPYGSLTLSGNLLYGMTYGYYTMGNIFSIDTDGSAYTDWYNFNNDGEYPRGDLTIIGDTLYGMTTGGGANREGVIFSYVPCTSAPVGPVTGDTIVEVGDNYTYTVEPAAGAISYSWWLPGTWSANNTTTSVNSITVSAGYLGGYIYVSANDSCGSSPLVSIPVHVYDTAAGITPVVQQGISVTVFPNPSSGQFSLQVSEIPAGSNYFELFDCTGKKVCTSQTASALTGIDLPGISSGLYLWQFRTGNNVLKRGKLVIE